MALLERRGDVALGGGFQERVIGGGMLAKASLRGEFEKPFDSRSDAGLRAQQSARFPASEGSRQSASPIPIRGTQAFQAAPSPASNAEQELWSKAETVLKAQRAWLANLNKSLPEGLTIVALPLIPPGVWWREHGGFLMQAFEFYPASLANTMMAANEPVSARRLELPLAPRVHNKLLEDSMHLRIGDLRRRFATEHENMGLAFARGDFTGLGSSIGRKARYGRELAEIASSIGMAAFGKQAWETHERNFNRILGQRKI